MSTFLNIIFSPFRALRDFLVMKLLRLRAKMQMGSLRDAIREADRLSLETGRKYLVVYNNATKEYEPIEKQLLKAAHKRRKLVTANDKRLRGKEEMGSNRGMKLARVKQLEKRSVYGTRNH